ncbi:14683_t:CDS:1 [Acaulospora morrowiae]|uniref:14683_t:CDS:1 n=1 Tax=Acaulospora morrowiae TaxID=94023 RepID=A0A9N8VV60_9GLOM|nr:14683_t:CDS:1 [Acaulospora morrowiae]
MSIEQIWDEYKQQRDGDYFTDSASVVFVPTASGARGYDAVRQFLAAAYDPRVLGIKENVIKRTVGPDSIVEELDTTISFVTGEGSWIVPGVDSRYLVDNKVVIPMVTTATFEGDRIISIRIYWDQASVLKQLKLVSDKNSWPIVSEKQVDALRDISSAHLNPFGRNDLAAGVSRMNISQPQPTGRRGVHTSSRVLQPGGTGGRSSVFGDDSEDSFTSRSRYNSNKNQSQFSIGEDNEQAPYERLTHSQKKMNPNSNASQIQIGDDFMDDQLKKRGTGSNEDSGTRTAYKPSSRITKPPGGGGSQITFG